MRVVFTKVAKEIFTEEVLNEVQGWVDDYQLDGMLDVIKEYDENEDPIHESPSMVLVRYDKSKAVFIVANAIYPTLGEFIENEVEVMDLKEVLYNLDTERDYDTPWYEQ